MFLTDCEKGWGTLANDYGGDILHPTLPAPPLLAFSLAVIFEIRDNSVTF